MEGGYYTIPLPPQFPFNCMYRNSILTRIPVVFQNPGNKVQSTDIVLSTVQLTRGQWFYFF